MPELPEVETIRRALAREIVGSILKNVSVHEPRLLQNASERQVRRALVGRRLVRMGRRAKFLLFDFGKHTAALHLRMTGQLLLEPPKTTRLTFEFEEKTVYLEDTRRFATLYFTKSTELNELLPLAKLGIEPFQKDFSLANFTKLLQTDQEIKCLLLDQRKIAGLGNIYSCETLFATQIHPQRPAHSLSKMEARRLFIQIEKMLEQAITEQGTSVNTYRLLTGESGGFQNLLLVYDREGEPCIKCKTLITRIEQSRRGTYFCPRCQPI